MKMVKKITSQSIPHHFNDRVFKRNNLYLFLSIILIARFQNTGIANASQLKAGVAKVNITNLEAGGLVRDSVYARALVLENGPVTVVIISIDILALDAFIDTVRLVLQKDMNINPANVLFNASQLHTARPVCSDVGKRIADAVKEAWRNKVPVNVGTGVGYKLSVST